MSVANVVSMEFESEQACLAPNFSATNFGFL